MDGPALTIDGTVAVFAFAVSEGVVIGGVGGYMLLRKDATGIGVGAVVGVAVALAIARRYVDGSNGE